MKNREKISSESDRLTSIFFKHRNHAWGLITNRILHYKPISWPSEQVFDELLFLCESKHYDYLPLIKNTCDISGTDLLMFP
jgi:hypothetical protein